MTKENKLILVGVISSAHGIKGNVVINSYTEPKQNIISLDLIDKKDNIITLNLIRNIKDKVICSIEDCNNRSEAEANFVGKKLYCRRNTLPATDENEFYFEDLKGKAVKSSDGKDIGAISNIVNYGAGDIIEIVFNSDIKEFISFTKENFPLISDNHIVITNECLNHLKSNL